MTQGKKAHLEGGVRTTQQDPEGRGKVSPGSKVLLEGSDPESRAGVPSHTHIHTLPQHWDIERRNKISLDCESFIL